MLTPHKELRVLSYADSLCATCKHAYCKQQFSGPEYALLCSSVVQTACTILLNVGPPIWQRYSIRPRSLYRKAPRRHGQDWMGITSYVIVLCANMLSFCWDDC